MLELPESFSAAEVVTLDTLWKDHITQSTWRTIRREFIRISDYEW
jgi:hypothetical protein